MADTRPPDAPEFHVVVRRPNRKGPLAAYRFAITVAFAFAVSGMPLWRATETGDDLDAALVRIALTALFVWIVFGRIDRILAATSAPPRRPADDEPPGG